MGCSYLTVNNEKCDARYELKYLLFRDPVTRESKEIALCPAHFVETVQEPLITPIRNLSRKRDNLISKHNRERAIAKRNEVVLLPSRSIEIQDIREQIRKRLAFKCSNILCGTSISNLNPVYSMLVISNSGKVSYKFYFCTKTCWDKMRIRTGAIKPIMTKSVPLTEYS